MMRAETERKTRRWQAERWILDHVVKLVGLDWDQGRTQKILRNCGPSVAGELQEIGRRVQKFVDIPRELARAAERRERLGRDAEKAGYDVEAREHYFVAATFYGNAQWGIFEDGNAERIRWGERLRECYDRFIRYADRRIERVELPFEGRSIPALLHLPSHYRQGEKLPCCLFVTGMDGIKEDTPLYDDPFLERGIALLSIDGPGQGEARSRGITVTASNHEEAGRAACDYLASRPEVDPERLVIYGVSMGSYWGTRIAAAEPRLKACAVSGVCVEPGQHAIFNTASPTFKLNYMFMSGYDDEDAFDKFAETLTLKGVTDDVRCPYFVVAGEDDELCPIECVYDLMQEIRSPKLLAVYEGEKHSIRNPGARTRIHNWLKDRLDGKPFEPRHIYVRANGDEIPKEW